MISLRDGEHEVTKACWHGAMACLVAGAAGYNALAWIKKPSWNQGLGALFYVALLGAEARLVVMHLERSRYVK